MTSVALCLALTLAASPQSRDREALRRALESVTQEAGLKGARVSAQVQSLDDGTVIFGTRADELLNPASNVKLFTAAAALLRLGLDYRFETEFLVETDAKDSKAKVLYVRGKGDPSLSTERVWGAVSELMHAGLKDVSDIVVDDSYFDADRNPPGFDQETGDRAYLAPTGALSLNSNTVGIYVRPGPSVGAAAVVEVDPPSDLFVVNNRLVTGTRTQGKFHVSVALERDKGVVRQRLTVAGHVPVGTPADAAWKKIDEPALYFGETLKALLVQRGIAVKGRVREGAVPPAARPLYVAQSDTLDIILKRLNKLSSNFFAEQLVKTLGAEGRGAPGSTAKGIDVIEEVLEKEVGLRRGTYVMRNGSGLNDTNRFSASQTNRLMKAMWERFPLAPEFLSSLAIAGKDGSVRHRFEGSEAVGRLRAKTGTLENVRALSGYVQAVGGEHFIFSMMINDFSGRGVFALRHLDAFGAALSATGSAGGPSAAVASMAEKPSVVGPLDALKARLETLRPLLEKPDRRQIAFLRTAYRTEKDPALRAVIGEAMVRTAPYEAAFVGAFLDAYSPGDDVFGRLKHIALEKGEEVLGLRTLEELAARGVSDAIDVWLKLSVEQSDEKLSARLSAGLAELAEESPAELIQALGAVPDNHREKAFDSLAAGMVAASRPEASLWPALKAAQASVDEHLADFARLAEIALSQRIAQAKAVPLAPEGGGATGGT